MGWAAMPSPPDAAYNCVAWAVEDTDRWWDPADEHGYYWPSGVRRELSLSNLIAALSTVGFDECENGAPEAAFQKVAIYSDTHGWPTHVARQLASGTWSSKLASRGYRTCHSGRFGRGDPWQGRSHPETAVSNSRIGWSSSAASSRLSTDGGVPEFRTDTTLVGSGW